MTTSGKTILTVYTMVNSPVEKVWKLWTEPEHIVSWNHASDDWHTPKAQNDLHEGGKFCWRMEAKDGSAGFDFEGNKINSYDKCKYLSEFSQPDRRSV